MVADIIGVHRVCETVCEGLHWFDWGKKEMGMSFVRVSFYEGFEFCEGFYFVKGKQEMGQCFVKVLSFARALSFVKAFIL